MASLMAENKTDTPQHTAQTDKRIKIKRALISLSDKNKINDLAKALHDAGVEILSTGGTAKAIKDMNIPVTDVSDYTGFPEIMDGRVKTLHPKIHGGLLAIRDKEAHQNAMSDNDIGDIDMLVVNLYPFTETVSSGADAENCIENIDIGGPAMIRAAAKNHAYVTVVTDPADYDALIEELGAHEGAVSYETRKKLGAKAFAHTAHYDAHIANWFLGQDDPTDKDSYFPEKLSFTGTLQNTLRYGENPHQMAALYLDGTNRPGVATATQVQGKELSYNNLNDTDAAFELISEFTDPAVAIIKHANPAGVAIGKDITEAYQKALRCDPVSAFGGIIAMNKPLNAEAAIEMSKLFCEVIIAPSIENEALNILSKKEKLRVLTTGAMPDPTQRRLNVKTLSGSLLVQTSDNGQIDPDALRVVTDREPTDEELRDMIFAFKVAKHVKSNAIIYAKDNATAGIGAGQMSRIDSSRIAARKAIEAAEQAGLEESLAKGSVVASDAFFPFPDGLIAAADAGVTAVIQPGGSIRDDEVIEAANERGLAMIFTDMRHFRH